MSRQVEDCLFVVEDTNMFIHSLVDSDASWQSHSHKHDYAHIATHEPVHESISKFRALSDLGASHKYDIDEILSETRVANRKSQF